KENFELRTMKSQFVESKLLPDPPKGNIKDILLYLIRVIKENFEMKSIGKAFELARDNLRKIVLHLDCMWEMSKLANLYQRKEPNLGLSQKEKKELIEKINSWIESSSSKAIKIGPNYV
ncbi:MAG: hypothetical protein ACFFAN_14335, partial [Promethearchaeota archaeon]